MTVCAHHSNKPGGFIMAVVSDSEERKREIDINFLPLHVREWAGASISSHILNSCAATVLGYVANGYGANYIL